MQIKHIKLENFRNYGQAEIEWHPAINLLFGLNAQGKSNLLEAVCYLSLTTSFRAATEQELLAWGAPHFFVEGQIETEQAGLLTVSAACDRRNVKRWRLDGQAKARKSELVGLFHTVVFSPADIDLVKAGPGERRRFLNRQISQLYPEHCRHLLRYNKILAQRNSCLRQLNEHGGAAEALDIWDVQLAETGAEIIWRRRRVLEALTPLAGELHSQLSGGEELHLRYKSFAGEPEAASAPELQTLLLAELNRLRRAELSRGATLAGPHRDDILIEINGVAAKTFASQGQQRTAALSLKLAELNLGRQQRGEWPVLLLDDVLSELDEKRQRQLLSRLDGQVQTIITSTSCELPLPVGKKYQIIKGKPLLFEKR